MRLTINSRILQLYILTKIYEIIKKLRMMISAGVFLLCSMIETIFTNNKREIKSLFIKIFQIKKQMLIDKICEP